MSIDSIISLCKRRGFIYPGSEIYGGFGNSYTYGPYGVEVKNNIKSFWWERFVRGRKDLVGIDGDIILHPKAWEASGHVGGFNDQMVDCKNCNARLRADHLVEDQIGEQCEGVPDEEVTKLIRDNNIKCPKCGKSDLTDVRKFSLMFSTQMAKTGEDSTAYLRPETAQAIFLEFKNITDSMRVKLPFGIGQIGKAFRNEITPGNFIFRRLEFEQMEIEYFIAPPPGFEKNREKYMASGASLDDWEKEDREHVLEVFEAWQVEMKAWCDEIGLTPSRCHDVEHPVEKLSHYSKKTVDIEYDFPFGKKELYGLAYRTDFDLSQHREFSGKDIRYRDEESNEKFIPHVIEPTFGLDRSILAVLCEAYAEEGLEDGTSRVVMKFKPRIAPVKVAVLPLLKKDGLPEKAHEVFDEVSVLGNCDFDISGTIGKRYRRQDEVGTPVCVTVDHQTLEDNTVTVRDRDSMGQERVLVSELVGMLRENYF